MLADSQQFLAVGMMQFSFDRGLSPVPASLFHLLAAMAGVCSPIFAE